MTSDVSEVASVTQPRRRLVRTRKQRHCIYRLDVRITRQDERSFRGQESNITSRELNGFSNTFEAHTAAPLHHRKKFDLLRRWKTNGPCASRRKPARQERFRADE